MIHPKTALKFISPQIGYGVVATEFIPAGTITWALDDLDREFTPQQVAAMGDAYKKILDTYCYRNNKGNLILCWDFGRYVNHSFNSNCISTAYDFEIAIRDIQIGEQLTDDYGYLNIQEPFRAMDEGTERKIVYPDDLLNYAKVWDAKLLSVFNRITTLKQPLLEFLSKEVILEVEAIIRGEKEMASIGINHYYQNE